MEKQKTIQELTDIELKSVAYDQIAAMEQSQRNLDLVNDEIKRRHDLLVDLGKVKTPYFEPLEEGKSADPEPAE